MGNGNRMVTTVLGVLLVIVIFSGLVIYSLQRRPSKPGEKTIKAADPLVGGNYEASDVAQVAGTDGVLIVDDGKPGEVLWMQLDRNGKQAGSIKEVSLGVHIHDPEGLTTDGTYFYIVSSLSETKDHQQPAMARFRFDKNTQSVDNVESISGLREFLFENVVELQGFESTKNKDDGLNIEGLAWDPTQRRLLLGLRSPVIDGNALLVPLKLKDPGGRFSFDNLEAGKIESIRLPIGGLGIRSIEYDQRKSLFYIIAGAAKGENKTDFKLLEWNGQTGTSALREIATFDRKLQPEGVAPVVIGDRSFVLIVFDTSKYLTIQ
jgi:uncharacterized protein DUF3616